jgi:hypothetical protein
MCVVWHTCQPSAQMGATSVRSQGLHQVDEPHTEHRAVVVTEGVGCGLQKVQIQFPCPLLAVAHGFVWPF